MAEETGLEPAQVAPERFSRPWQYQLCLLLHTRGTYWWPQTLGFKCLVVSRVSLLRHITTKSYSTFFIPLRDAPNELLRRSGYLLWHMTSILAWYLYLHYTSLSRLSFSAFGGQGGIRTLARFYPPNPLAGGPLWPLGYLAIFNISAPKAHYVNYEIKKQPCGWCKKLPIDIVFCSICFRNIWKGTSIPPRIPLAEFVCFSLLACG